MLFAVIKQLANESSDPELNRLMNVAGHLHPNFYEHDFNAATVAEMAEEVDDLLERLKAVDDS